MATASVTNNFTAGTPAVADDVDQNFSDLVSFLNNNVVHKDGTVTMTGLLTLPSGTDPSTDHHAAKYKQVKAMGSRARNATGQSFTDNTITTLSFTAALRNDGGTYWTAGSPTIFTVPSDGAGIYIFGFQLFFQSTAFFDVRAQIYKNGTGGTLLFDGSTYADAGAATLNAVSAHTVDALAAGDTILFRARVNGSTASYTAGAANQYEHVGYIYRIAPT